MKKIILNCVSFKSILSLDVSLLLPTKHSYTAGKEVQQHAVWSNEQLHRFYSNSLMGLQSIRQFYVKL